jgi:hypothetical protein
MERKSWLILFGICLLIAPITFALGRWSRPAKDYSSTVDTRFAAAVRSHQEQQRTSERVDLAKVTIENIGEVEFDQVYELLRSAPNEALLSWIRRLEELPVTPRKTAAIKAFFKTLAQIDAKAAVDLALGMERAESRWTAIGAVGVATPAGDLEEVARMYMTINETRIAIVGDLVGTWSATDPEATARFLGKYPGKVENDELTPFLANWAALDPTAAREWLAEAEPARRDPGAYASLYSGWVLHDRAAALSDLATHAADKTFAKAIERVTENLFTDSAEAARAFILNLPDAAAQEAAVSKVTGHITNVYLGGGDPLKLKADEVAKWLFTLPENLWQKDIGSVIDEWAREDQPALEAWFTQMTPQMRDRLLAEQCGALNSNIPGTGLRAGLRISDPALRQDTFRRVFQDWAEKVKEELFQRAELSDEELRELKKTLQRL